MRWTTVVLGLCALLIASEASARTTKEFLYRCETDQAACATKIKEARRLVEVPPPGRAPTKLCLPAGMDDETLVFEVTYWIGEQFPPMDNKDENESLTAALTALYACNGIKGMEGDAQ